MMKVFVYGTLKPGERNYALYCGDRTHSQVAAYTKGLLYHLPVGYPAMTAGNSRVKGVLLTFTDDTVLPYLDELEDYDKERSPELNLYYRSLVPVYDQSDRFLAQAWCYFMSQEKVKQFQGVILPSGCWQDPQSGIG